MTTAEMSMHQTAETQFVDVGGVWFAFRRFGTPGATPLLMLQHFRGNLDNWDPALTDALAGEREVILVDYPGVGASSGHFGPSIADTARRMIAFAETLGLAEVDLLGFSIGGFVAQEIALIRPALVRRLVLAATGPKGGPGMHGWREDIATAARLDETTAESLLHIFFAPTETSRARAVEFLGRFMARSKGRDTPTTLAARDAQYDAIVEWGIPDHAALQRLTAIGMPHADHPGRRRPDDPDQAQPPDGRPDPGRADPHLPGLGARLPVPGAAAGRRGHQRLPRLTGRQDAPAGRSGVRSLGRGEVASARASCFAVRRARRRPGRLVGSTCITQNA